MLHLTQTKPQPPRALPSARAKVAESVAVAGPQLNQSLASTLVKTNPEVSVMPLAPVAVASRLGYV